MYQQFLQDKKNLEKKNQWEEKKIRTREFEKWTREAREDFYDNVKEWKMNRVNLPCQIDAFFRSKNIRKEFYHGGKYNGVNCIRIMEQSNLLIDHICDEVVKIGI